MSIVRGSIVAYLVVLVACSDATTATDPVWGKQPCAHCHMLVSDPATAAQLRTHTGERLHFDDVGCLVEHVAARGGEVDLAWVRDARGQWVNALRARYRSGASTPMGYGFVVDERGSLDFTRLQREIAQRGIARSAP